MKKLFFALMLAGASASMVFAQEAVNVDMNTPEAVAQEIEVAAPAVMEAVEQAAEKAVESMTITGTVESLTAKDDASELVLAIDAEQKITLVVKPTTTIYDAEWKATSLDKVTVGAVVKVKYLASNGVNEALAINISQ